jgi:hypothetical protein
LSGSNLYSASRLNILFQAGLALATGALGAAPE